MFSENNKGIGVYLIYSAIFHILLIGLIIYLSIRYRPEIQSIGSKVVVSVVSRVPGPLASVKSILYPPKPKTEEHPAVRPVPLKTVKSVSIPLAKSPYSMVYPKKTAQKQVPVRRYAPPHPYVPVISSNAYTHIHHLASLEKGYSRQKESLIRGNIHRFQGYVNKIVSIIMSNSSIFAKKYINYKSIVAFQISKSGRIYAVRLVKSSGNGYFDSQSIAAVKLSSPLPPPPAGFMSFENNENDGEGVLMNFNPREILKDRP